MSYSEESITPTNKPNNVVINRSKRIPRNIPIKIIRIIENDYEQKLEEIKKRQQLEEIKKKQQLEEIKKKQQLEEIKKRQQRENVSKFKKDKEELLALDGKLFIYQNQQDAADECIKAYNNGAVAVCLIAQPGIGKTGTAQAVMYHMATNPNDEDIIYTEDIINCTGMSDNDWVEQFRNNVLPPFKDNIYHRQQLIKQIDKLQNLKNGLIIPDECHVAAGSKMTIAKILKEAGILDLRVLELRNIKMLDISATPDAVLHDYIKWGPKCSIIKIQPGASYKGFEVMLEEKRIIDAPILEELDDYRKFLAFLDKRYKNTTKKYFPFRLLDPIKINILESACTKLGWDCLNHNSSERVDEIDTLMSKPPIKHTIIFIKGFWRASKRISMKHIGATYEPIPKQRDVSVTAQALTARFCDNYEYSGDQLDINLRPLHYCDKEAIEQYVEWFNNDCDFSVSKYKSHRISSNGKGKVISKKTKVNIKIVGGIDDNSDSDNIKEPVIKKFDTYEEAKDYYNTVLKEKLGGKCRGPNKIKLNEHGYCEANIRGNKQVYSCEEIYKERRCNIENGAGYGFRPCYVDKNDKSTLQFWFIHY